MMTRAFCLLAIVALAACGVDGEPVQPTGAVSVGIGSGGINAGGTIGVRKGPLSVGVGIF
ncbi:MAG: hypothetical protein AAF214_02280 [Pseudomonadota bacterium]